MPDYQVRFQPSNLAIRCEGEQSIMEAALAQGVAIPVSCKNGVCGVCQAVYLSGKLVFRNSLGEQILEQNNQVLCCIAQPKSDVELSMSEIYAANQKPTSEMAFQVKGVSLLADNLYQVLLLAPAGKSPDYWPGQYLMLHVGEADQVEQLPYSIACAPGQLTGKDTRLIELHIATHSEKAQKVVEFIQNSSTVRATLAMGSCLVNEHFLSATAPQPLIMVAASSGFSQIKTLIEGTLALAPEREVHFYWSVPTAEGFYMKSLPEEWAKSYDNFHFHPLIHEEAADWHGRSGWLHDAIREDFSDLNNTQMFVCGSPDTVFTILKNLSALGLSQENMHSDVFEYASPE